MTKSWPQCVASTLAFVAMTFPAPAADARVDGNSAYTKTQTYSAALRYVRVDLGYEVVEKDPEAGYLIFKYAATGASKTAVVTGTLEVIEASGGVRLFVNLPRVPEYYERLFRDGLLKKLRDEYGAAPGNTKRAPQSPAPDKPAAPAEGS